MKPKLRIIALACCLIAALPAVFTGCHTPVDQRVVAYQTLKATGEAAESAVKSAGLAYKSGLITAAQLQRVVDLFDNKFQPAYNLAKNAAGSDLAIASPDVAALLDQLSTLVASFGVKPSNQ